MTEDYAVGESDRVLYAKQIERIKLRLDEIYRLNRDMRDERGVLYAAAQLRLAIEEVSFASLVGNRKLLEAAERSIRLNGWDKANKALSNVNPDYWPSGVIEVAHDDGRRSWEEAPDVLTVDEVPKIWGRLSAQLHAKNPYVTPLDLGTEAAFILESSSRLVRTLNSHLIKLAGTSELLFCQAWSTPVRVYLFGEVGVE